MDPISVTPIFCTGGLGYIILFVILFYACQWYTEWKNERDYKEKYAPKDKEKK